MRLLFLFLVALSSTGPAVGDSINISEDLNDTVVNPGQAVLVSGQALFDFPPFPGYRADNAVNG